MGGCFSSSDDNSRVKPDGVVPNNNNNSNITDTNKKSQSAEERELQAAQDKLLQETKTELEKSGWILHENKTLLGYPPALGENSFNTLSEAYQKAIEIEVCGGIIMVGGDVNGNSGSPGVKYEIRLTQTPVPAKGQNCYVKPHSFLSKAEIEDWINSESKEHVVKKTRSGKGNDKVDLGGDEEELKLRKSTGGEDDDRESKNEDETTKKVANKTKSVRKSVKTIELESSVRNNRIKLQRQTAKRVKRNRALNERKLRDADPEEHLIVEADFGNVRGVFQKVKAKDSDESDTVTWVSHNDRPVWKRVPDAEGSGDIYLCHDGRRWVLNWTMYDNCICKPNVDDENKDSNGVPSTLPNSVITLSIDCPESKTPMNPRRWGDFSKLKKMGSGDTFVLAKSLWEDDEIEGVSGIGSGLGLVEVGTDSKGRWTDPDFPPNEQSLGPNASIRYGDLIWVRGSRLHKGETMILYESVQPTDVLQGILGDCWLLGAISAVAEFPGFFEEKVFNNGEAEGSSNNNRISKRPFPVAKFDCTNDCRYRFNLWSPFTKRIEVIEVDDWLPVYRPWRGKFQARSECAFAKPSNTNELWVSLLEKAFAKLFGSYESLNGGQAIVGCAILTGLGGLTGHSDSKKGLDIDGDGESDSSKTCFRWRLEDSSRAGDSNVKWEQILLEWSESGKKQYYSWGDIKSNEEIWEMICSNDVKNYVQFCDIAPGSGHGIEHKRSDGLIEGHSYSLLSAIEVKNLMGNTVRLLQIRNPWGDSTEWNGDYSDNSPMWDSIDEKQELEIKHNLPKRLKAADGVFWMCWEDWIKIWTGVGVCPYGFEFRRRYELLDNNKNQMLSLLNTMDLFGEEGDDEDFDMRWTPEDLSEVDDEDQSAKESKDLKPGGANTTKRVSTGKKSDSGSDDSSGSDDDSGSGSSDSS